MSAGLHIQNCLEDGEKVRRRSIADGKQIDTQFWAPESQQVWPFEMFRIYNQYLEGQDTDSVREVCVANIHIEYTVHNKENTHLYANMFAWCDKNT